MAISLGFNPSVSRDSSHSARPEISSAIEPNAATRGAGPLRMETASRVNRISCRNLLIYMGGGLQKKLFPLFHYALNPDGMLFLGTSETVGEFVDLFATLDRKSKLYQRREEVAGAHRTGLLPRLPEDGPVPRPSSKVAGESKVPVRE